jgi:hypothetical protein
VLLADSHTLLLLRTAVLLLLSCSLDPAARYYGDNLASSGRYLEKARHYYDMNTPINAVSHVSTHTTCLCYAAFLLSVLHAGISKQTSSASNHRRGSAVHVIAQRFNHRMGPAATLARE